MEAVSTSAEIGSSFTVATTSGRSAARAVRPKGISSAAPDNRASKQAGTAERRDNMVRISVMRSGP